MPVPQQPKIYHIVHVDRLPSIVADGCLWSDAVMMEQPGTGTTIGMNDIKQRRLKELRLSSRPGLYVGQCVPFYFCPRSVMLYLIYTANHPNLTYRDGQSPIVHLEADLCAAVDWADRNQLRWAFTLSNAGAYYFRDHCNLDQLDKINWTAVEATKWAGDLKEGKQAEFLVERSFPWELVERVGVLSRAMVQPVSNAMQGVAHRPRIDVRADWYY
jgi:hypothetical protein